MFKYLLTPALFLCFWWAVPSAMAQDTEDPAATTQPTTAKPASETPENPADLWATPDEDERRAKQVIGMDRTSSYFDMLGSLFLVVGLILLLAWLVQKYLPKRLGALGESKQLKLIQSLPLGPRRYVSLVEADGRRFLLGVTDTQINLIKALDEIPFEQAFSGIDEPRTVDEMMEEEL